MVDFGLNIFMGGIFNRDQILHQKVRTQDWRDHHPFLEPLPSKGFVVLGMEGSKLGSRM